MWVCYRTVMGSVSSYLTRHCPCPVLICKLDPSEIEARKELDSKKQATFVEVLSKYNHGVCVVVGPPNTTVIDTFNVKKQ